MRYLGFPKHKTKTGFLVVQIRTKTIPPIGSSVITRRMKKIGRILDIIGPVSEPYAVVKLTREIDESILSTPLYYKSYKPRRKTMRRR